MINVYDGLGVEIGGLEGAFVVSSSGERIYWIDNEEVFSIPDHSAESLLARNPSIRIGTFDGTTAKGNDGETFFTTDPNLVK